MKQYVIIGNGVAAAGCIEGIRSVDTGGSIAVVSEEKRPVYCRPLISYYLEGKTDLDKMNYRAPDFYEKTGCKILYGQRAVRIDNKAKTVILDNGRALPFDTLCVAAGSAPVIPPVAGLETVKRPFSFMTIDDTLALSAAVSTKSRVLIVGAGLIGLKCAEGLKDRAASITVCDLADRVLSSILDTDCAAIIQARLESNGIRFLLGDSVECFDGSTAMLKSGKTVEFDVLVLAVGVRANSALVRDMGGKVHSGILVNDRMETSEPGVYAAGDCTECDDISCGRKRVLALFPNAYMQGYTAGVNMAGGHQVFDKAIPMNSIGFFGLHAMTAGSCFSEDQGGECYEEKADGKIKRLFTRNGYLTGFTLIGETDRAGIYTSLIRERIPLASIQFDVLQKKATYAAFPPDIRRKKFGGVV